MAINLPRIVIKIGGDVVADKDKLTTIVGELGAIRDRYAPVVIHGGGPQATQLTTRLGLEPNVVGGRRITSPDVLDVMKMTLAGSVNVELAAAFRALNLPGLGCAGVSAGLIRATKRPPRIVSGCGDTPVDFGEVGDVLSVDTGKMNALIEAGFIPVLSSLSADDSGRVLNINADIVACDVAIALQAHALILLTGADGVLTDIDDPMTRFPQLSIAQAKGLITDGTVYGGMIPKLEESFRVIERGVQRVIILKAGSPGALSGSIMGTLEKGTTLHA